MPGFLGKHLDGMVFRGGVKFSGFDAGITGFLKSHVPSMDRLCTDSQLRG